jgi:hypothetical protein
VLSVSIVVLASWIFWQRDGIIDHVTVWRYQPTPEVLALADATSMSQSGRWNFYVADPSLESRESFNNHCTNGHEKTIVLGCYAARKIYIYNVNDERLPYVEEVTAAHEMLHAAYERLSESEREQVNRLVDSALDGITNKHVKSLINLYRKNEPDHLHNEMHSILGTEANKLPADLEEYYSQYFDDRTKVVKMSQQYQSVFNELQDQQRKLSNELAALSKQIDALSQVFETNVAAFEAKIDAFNQKARGGGFESEAEYDSEYAVLIAEQNRLEEDRGAINSLVDTHNKKREQLQNLIIETNSLNESIDSRGPAEVPEV